jgi:hypothetical protein
MMTMTTRYRRTAGAALAVAALAAATTSATTTKAFTTTAAATAAAATDAAANVPETEARHAGWAPSVEILAPRHGDRTGTDGANWIVDLNVTYPTGTSGFTTAQLTGPGAHNEADPLPGTFGPGQDERLPGVVVLASTTSGFSGPGTNLANLFNITALTDKNRSTTTIQDTWIVGAPLFGTDVDSVITVAVIDDLDYDGVYDDAPATVPDANEDGCVDARDLRELGVASNVATARVHINGDVTP